MDFKKLKWYRTGKISILNGGTAVDGTGTSWLEADIKAGDVLITKDARPYEVASVASSTRLTLASPYEGDTIAGEGYSIIRRVPAVMQAEIANRLVSLIEIWERRDVSISTSLRLLTERVENMPRFVTYPLTIPVTGWTKDENDTTGYPWSINISLEDIRADMLPFVCIRAGSLAAAAAAGLCPEAEALDGALHLVSASVPGTALSATLALYGSSTAAISETGCGCNCDDNRDATDEEVCEAIEEVLNEP